MEKMQEAPVPGGSTYWLRLSIAPEDGPALEARAEIDAALWQELKVGDRIMTVYTLDPQDKQIRVQETGRVALPPELR
ncbi:MAG: hypothetical protein HYV27_14675 [Candidatus Hydrogenedentes bacterium]|nr:hypothetical protein [Candidatus Hydrogenedentota bacterium]